MRQRLVAALVVTYVMLLSRGAMAAGHPEDNITSMWRGNAPELGGDVVIMFVKPVVPLTDAAGLNKQQEALVTKFRASLEKGPQKFLIMKMTNATERDIKSGNLGASASNVYVRDAKGHFDRIQDKELLSKVIVWEGKQHGENVVRVGNIYTIASVLGALLVILLFRARSRRQSSGS